jgi:hypothetical protein
MPASSKPFWPSGTERPDGKTNAEGGPSKHSGLSTSAGSYHSSEVKVLINTADANGEDELFLLPSAESNLLEHLCCLTHFSISEITVTSTKKIVAAVAITAAFISTLQLSDSMLSASSGLIGCKLQRLPVGSSAIQMLLFVRLLSNAMGILTFKVLSCAIPCSEVVQVARSLLPKSTSSFVRTL